MRRHAPIAIWSLFAVLGGCAAGDPTPGFDGFVPRQDDGVPRADTLVWRDSRPPSPDLPPALDSAPLDAAVVWDVAVLDTAPADSAPADGGPVCIDPYETNATCASAGYMGSISEEYGWLVRSAFFDLPGDVDWLKADAKEVASMCFPGTSQCFVLTARMDVPKGVKAKLCLYRDTCGATETCESSGAPGPSQLEVQYTVTGSCGSSDDSRAYLKVEATDGATACTPYQVAVRYDPC